MKLRSELGKVKGYGSAKHGSGHWLAQRFSALALIPLLVWFVAYILKIVTTDHITLVTRLSSPVNAVLLLLFIGTVLYHGTLGFQVVIEDYVSCEAAKVAIIFLTRAFAIVTAVALLVSVLTFHVNHVGLHKAIEPVEQQDKVLKKI